VLGGEVEFFPAFRGGSSLILVWLTAYFVFGVHRLVGLYFYFNDEDKILARASKENND